MHSVTPVVAALGATTGAWMGHRSPVMPAVLLLAAGLLLAGDRLHRRRCGWRGDLRSRRAAASALCVCALAGAAAARAHAGLQAPEPGVVEGVATLVRDPEPRARGVRAVVSLHGQQYEAMAWNAPAGSLGRVLAGERVRVRGRVTAEDVPRWLRQRHISGRLVIEAVEPGPVPAPVVVVAARLHRLLQRGAEPLGEHGPLYRGLILGDDRDQSEEVRIAFLDAGLSHLTAVSGQNVAFVLSIAAPLLTRLPRRGRVAVTLCVLAVFVLLTRAEPSVLRAALMAAVAVVRAAQGRRRDGLGALGWAVTVLLVVDPFLVRSVGFWLSVVATAGILLWSASLAAWLPGPRPLRAALGVTLAAQIATAPMLVAVFGSVPLVSIPANVLAGPLAAVIMLWGLPAGLFAGIVGGWAAAVAQQPTLVAVAALDLVARESAAIPLGELEGRHLLAGALAVLVVRLARRPRRSILAAICRMSALR